jgi:hypothetical protein
LKSYQSHHAPMRENLIIPVNGKTWFLWKMSFYREKLVFITELQLSFDNIPFLFSNVAWHFLRKE